MEASRHLRSVDMRTGEVIEGCPDCERNQAKVESLTGVLVARDRRITELKNENARLRAVEPEHKDVIEVLTYCRDLLRPSAAVTVDSDSYKAVRARLRDTDETTGEPAFSVAALKAAAFAISLSPWHMEKGQTHRRDPANAFGNAGKVTRLLGDAIGFKRTYGISGLDIVERLGGEGFEWLAERCSCGGLWIEHLYGGGPTPDGRQPCERTGCESFDWFEVRVARWFREMDRRAEAGDKEAAYQLEQTRHERRAS